MRYILSLLAMVILAVSFMVACGDEKSNDPTENYINNAATDESACRDACSKLAKCLTVQAAEGQEETAAVENEIGKEAFEDDCKQKCDQSGFFNYEVILCIQKAECSQVFSCGAPLAE